MAPFSKAEKREENEVKKKYIYILNKKLNGTCNGILASIKAPFHPPLYPHLPFYSASVAFSAGDRISFPLKSRTNGHFPIKLQWLMHHQLALISLIGRVHSPESIPRIPRQFLQLERRNFCCFFPSTSLSSSPSSPFCLVLKRKRE